MKPAELLALTITALAAGGMATERRRTSNICTKDENCPDNAFCRMNSYCVCKDGFVFVANGDQSKACLKVAQFGEPCTQHIQCTTVLGVHGECNAMGVCACKPDTQLSEDRCYKASVVGERCMVSANCFLPSAEADPDAQAFCVRGYCTCQLNYSPRDNGTRCVKDAKLGEPCEDQEQCFGYGLQCQKTCECKDGLVPHTELGSCVQPVQALYDACEFDVQCAHLSGAPGFPSGDATYCLGGECACAFNARPVGDPAHCWTIRRPGEECKRNEECLTYEDEQGICYRGRCSCKDCLPDDVDFNKAAILTAPTFALILVAAILA